jgi:hypothetical protein
LALQSSDVAIATFINYQAAARRADGTPIVNQNINIKFEILQGSSSSSVIVSESQTVTTNALGLFATQIGKSGLLNAVNWQNGPTFLHVQIDTANTNNFLDLGTQQFVSVPYAMHSADVPTSFTNNIITIGSKSYTLNSVSGSNATITPSGVLTVTASGNSFTVDAPAPQYDAATGNLVTGTSTINITPTMAINGNVLSVGPTNNTIALPTGTAGAGPNTSITTTGGGATVTTSEPIPLTLPCLPRP